MVEIKFKWKKNNYEFKLSLISIFNTKKNNKKNMF